MRTVCIPLNVSTVGDVSVENVLAQAKGLFAIMSITAVRHSPQYIKLYLL